jgi:MYXO-CTERM domain-containing protein
MNWLRILLMGLGLLPAAHAIKVATISGSGSSPGFFHTLKENGIIVPDILLSDQSPEPFGLMTASAAVTYGSIKVFGSSSGSTEGTSQTGQFQDGLTFHVPGLADGTPILVTAPFGVGGSLLACDLCSSGWDLQISLGQFIELTGQLFFHGVYGGDALGAHSHTFTVANGVQVFLSVQLGGGEGGDGVFPDTADGSAIDDLAHSFSWGGVSSVTMSDGTPVSSFTVTSQSGTDWSKPFVDAAAAPEPGAAGLTAVVLAGLGLMRRKRSRQRVR